MELTKYPANTELLITLTACKKMTVFSTVQLASHYKISGKWRNPLSQSNLSKLQTRRKSPYKIFIRQIKLYTKTMV